VRVSEGTTEIKVSYISEYEKERKRTSKIERSRSSETSEGEDEIKKGEEKRVKKKR